MSAEPAAQHLAPQQLCPRALPDRPRSPPGRGSTRCRRAGRRKRRSGARHPAPLRRCTPTGVWQLASSASTPRARLEPRRSPSLSGSTRRRHPSSPRVSSARGSPGRRGDELVGVELGAPPPCVRAGAGRPGQHDRVVIPSASFRRRVSTLPRSSVTRGRAGSPGAASAPKARGPDRALRQLVE